jgi:transcriptional regulator with XRE-family HTH domain
MNRLRALRQAKGWSQPRLIVAMEEQAKAERTRLDATRASLKTRISMWENGHSGPDEFYSRLLCSVFGVTEQELGFGDGSPPTALSLPEQATSVPSLAVTPEVVGFLGNVFDQYVQADRLLGPRAVIGVVAEQCKMIENLCSVATGSIRTDLLHAGAKFFEFGGWLAQDSGDFETAEKWSARALDMAYETGDSWLISYIFMRRSNIATDRGDKNQGVGLAQASMREAVHLGPRLKTLALRQQATALAAAGDERGCAEAIDGALIAVSTSSDGEPMADYCSTSYVQMEGAAAWTKLGKPDRAAQWLTEALASWPYKDQRDRGIGIARLATAEAMAGDLEAACSTAHQAVDAVRAAPSARAISDLNNLRARLGPWRGNKQVTEVIDLLRTLK